MFTRSLLSLYLLFTITSLIGNPFDDVIVYRSLEIITFFYSMFSWFFITEGSTLISSTWNSSIEFEWRMDCGFLRGIFQWRSKRSLSQTGLIHPIPYNLPFILFSWKQSETSTTNMVVYQSKRRSLLEFHTFKSSSPLTFNLAQWYCSIKISFRLLTFVFQIIKCTPECAVLLLFSKLQILCYKVTTRARWDQKRNHSPQYNKFA